MPYVATFDDYIDIDGVPLNTPAWTHQNLQDMLAYAAMRGENRIIPGGIGVRALPRRPTERTYTVNLAVYGDRRWDDVENPDAVAGLAANIEHLVTSVVDPLATTDSLRMATLHYGGATYSTAAQVVGFEVLDSLGPWVVQASMDVNLVQGTFW